MNSTLNSKNAISPLVATVIIIVITVTVGIVLYGLVWPLISTPFYKGACADFTFKLDTQSSCSIPVGFENEVRVSIDRTSSSKNEPENVGWRLVLDAGSGEKITFEHRDWQVNVGEQKSFVHMVDQATLQELGGDIKSVSVYPIIDDKNTVITCESVMQDVERLRRCALPSQQLRNNGVYFGSGWYTALEKAPFVDLQKLEASGADFALAYGWRDCNAYAQGGAPVEYNCIRDYLDQAQSRYLKVMLEMPRDYIENTNLNGIREFVRNLKTHPAVLGYYIYDEPDINYRLEGRSGLRPENLVQAYNAIKGEDSKPVFVVIVPDPNIFIEDYAPQCTAFGNPALHRLGCFRQGSTSGIREYDPINFCGEVELCSMHYYSQSADIVMIDYYPFWYKNDGSSFTYQPWWSMERTKTWTSFLHQRNKQFMAVTQGTYWLERDQQPPDNTLSLYPNKQQYRFYSIGNLISGSTGVLNFVHYRSSDEVVNNIIAPTSQDIRRFKNLFLMGQELACSPQQECQDVNNLLVQDSGNTYLLGVVNGNLQEKTATLEFPFNVGSLQMYEFGNLYPYSELSVQGNQVNMRIPQQTAVLFIVSPI